MQWWTSIKSAVDKIKKVSLKTLKKCNLKPISNMKAIIFLLAVLTLSACSTSSKVGGYQDHLRTDPKVNFYKRDNGGCGWHNKTK